MEQVRTLILLLYISYSTAASVTTSSGTWQALLSSNNPRLYLSIKYGECLSTTPFGIDVEAKTHDQSLPFKFKVTVVEILKSLFIVSIERIDKTEGWSETLIKFDWQLKFGQGGVAYKNRYIKLLYTAVSFAYSRSRSFTQCSSSGGKLVDIVDKEMYDVIYYYVATTFDSGIYNYVNIWTAMNFNTENGNVTQSNGEPGYNDDWNPGWPLGGSTRIGVVISVGTKPTAAPNVGLRNFSAAHTAVPLCMY
nr:uncharacterized protein LOC108949671 [Ciona intestinalis]|eukprot:XP_018668283.1 uncharacterized protein LOC108949671 [Ciona intestinalis]